MGAFTLIIYSGHDTPYNIDFVRSFTKMRNRGGDQTTTQVENSIDISKLNPEVVKRRLTRDELRRYSQYTFIFNSHRNAINDSSYNGAQPFEDPIEHQIYNHPELSQRPKRMLMCNGEIYNYKQLINDNKFTEKDLQSNSDVEVILPMYIKYGLEKTLEQIDGDYSFVLTENLNTFKISEMNIYVVRDILGTRPLYFVKHNTQLFYMFTSELKGIPDNILNSNNYSVTEIPPGCYWSFKNPTTFIKYNDFSKYKNIENCVYKEAKPQILENVYTTIRTTLKNSLIKRLDGVNNFGVLLSGGLDSSILLSLILECINENIIFPKKFEVFTLCKNYNDKNVINSKLTIDYLEKKYNLKINHHIVSLDDINFSIKSIDDIIYQLESFDPDTIRDSIPFYFLIKYISNLTNIKVLISGDGADEFCGYKQLNELFDDDYQVQSIKLLENLNKFDLLRTDKIAESHGIEVRYPFLDRNFIELMLSIHPKLKKAQQRNINEEPLEKYLLRKAYENNYIPDSILWKRMEYFCEYFNSFEEQLSQFFQQYYTDGEFAIFVQTLVKEQKNNMTLPKTKEEMYYRKIFNNFFPKTDNIIPYFWRDLWELV